MADDAKLAAPYVPFSTFETALDKLAQLGTTLPPKIDHTVFPSIGGIAKGQVISALKFFKLIDTNGIPTAELKELAMNKQGRKAAITRLIAECYPNISTDDLAGASPGQIDAKLSDKHYNISGDTKQKARAFLLKAAKYADIPLSKLLTQKGPRGPRQKRNGSAAKSNAKSERKDAPKNVTEIPTLPADFIRVPIAVAPDCLVYVDLPKNFDGKGGKDARKLLQMIKIALDVED